MKTGGQRLRVWLVDNGIVLAVVLLAVVFAVINPRFLTFNNFTTILLSIVELGLIALPLALLVMSGSIDLSLGSMASVGAVIFGMVLLATGSIFIAVIAALIFGLIAGSINGFLVSFLGLNPIVITLGFLAIWGGFALYLTQGKTLYGFPQSIRDLGSFSVAGVRIQLVILIVAVFVFWLILNRLPLGKQILAVGGSERVSFLIGIRFKVLRFWLFVSAGVLASLSGVMLAIKLFGSPPNIGGGMELRALTVVLLGGVAFAGGVGRISGVVAGLLFVGVLSNGLVIVGVNEFLQTMAIGFALVIAVTLDGTVRRFVRNSWVRSVAKEEDLTQENASSLATTADAENRS